MQVKAISNVTAWAKLPTQLLKTVSAGMLEDLHSLLETDPDAQVVANCMSVLLEVKSICLVLCKALPCAFACMPKLCDVM